MSLKINQRALDRVCQILDIGARFADFVITPEQTNPFGCTVVDSEDPNSDIVVRIFDGLDARTANWVALHELKHVSQEIHEHIQTSGKYRQAVIEAGFDPEVVMAVNREFDFANDPDAARRYMEIPYEKEADDFANAMDDLYEVVVEA